MYLKKLEIFGFKSFAEKTLLEFGPGITSVVGPNGCGKSNVFDSIRWVLGEQSIKNLRGSAREDVIFNGTDKRSPLGMAEVSLTFSNESKRFPVEYDEVTISRRLFRSGESEYLINKSVVRLKDVQEMLMGTGVGAEAYSLIQQGKVDQVVNAKPDDRRAILDEASGITKYKAKKKEAMNRLRDTDNNLLRVNDIVVEVKRQIGSIERQANKARRYKVEYEKLKEYEIRLALYQLSQCTHKQDDLSQYLNSLKEKEQSFHQEQQEMTDLLDNEMNHLGEIEQDINEKKSEDIKLDGKISLHHRQITFNQERIQTLTENDQKLHEQKQQLIEKCKMQQDKIASFKDNVIKTEDALVVKEQSLEEKKIELTDVERVLRESKSKIIDHEEKILEMTSTQVGIRNRLTEAMKELQGGIARKRRLDLENEKVQVEKQEIDSKLQNVENQINAFNGQKRELEQQKDAKGGLIVELKTKLIEIGACIDELEKQKVFFKSQKEFIEQMNTQYQDIPDPVVEGKFITKTPPLDHHTGIIGRVKDYGKYHEKKAGIFNLSRYFSRNQESTYYEVNCETKFIELDPQQILNKIDEISRELGAKISQRDSFHNEIREARAAFNHIEEEVLKVEKDISILEAQRNDIGEESKKLLNEIELVEIELSEVKESLGAVRKKEEELNYELDTVTQEIAWCQNDIKEKQIWIANKAQMREEITIAIAQIETEINADKEKLANQKENYEMYVRSLDEWLDEIKRIDDDVVDQANKKEQYAKESEELKVNIENIHTQRSVLQEEIAEHQAQKEDLGGRINSIKSNINTIEDEIADIKQKMHGEEMSEQELSFSERGIKDRLMQTYKIDLDHLPEAEPCGADAESEEQLDELGRPIKVAKVKDEKELTIEELPEEVDRLKKKCESYGSVNLVAIEEFEELRERFEFLTKQQSDLLEAKSQLMSTINKINRSTRQMFMDTFTKVSEEFRIYFRMLFGGGDANLVLVDPENVLESGIDIIARPPGKKLQNITLLSGGEKTLTAIALIFGVFKVNPSPFCVLDEIDAALDESNVGRFTYLLQDFSKIAQFVVITHNKKTMSKSDVMYGITMPETGVSRVVSVKMSDYEKKELPEEVAVGV